MTVDTVPTINVLFVFHNSDWEWIGYTLWKQGVKLDGPYTEVHMTSS